MDKFTSIKKEYDSFNSNDIKKADQKMKRLKDKLMQYGGIIDVGMMDDLEAHTKLLNSEENKKAAEFKIQVGSLE